MSEEKLSRRSFLQKAGVGAATLGLGVYLTGCASNEAKPKEGEKAPEKKEAQGPKVKVVHFSPTGGTENAAYILGQYLSPEAEYYPIVAPADREKGVEFAKEDLAVFAAPSYGGLIPLVDDMFTHAKGNDTPAVVLASFGNRNYDDCLAQMRALIEPQGFKVIGAISVVTPHVFSEKAGHSRPTPEDRKVIKEFADKILAKVKDGSFDAIEIPGNPTPEPKELKVPTKQFFEENCVRCMKCYEGCPKRAIDKETLAIDESKCISCQHCTYVCDFHGRSYDPTAMRPFIENNLFKHKAIETFA